MTAVGKSIAPFILPMFYTMLANNTDRWKEFASIDKSNCDESRRIGDHARAPCWSLVSVEFATLTVSSNIHPTELKGKQAGKIFTIYCLGVS